MNDSPEAGRRRHLLRLSVAVVAMFGFGFAMVPLYRLACQWTGVNLQAGEMRIAATAPTKVDTSRWVTVQFTTTVNGGRDWKFEPLVPSVRVHPGELANVSFHAQNPDGKMLVAQAVPSIAPVDASRHLRKTECFCFRQQVFQPHEGRDMPVRFMLDPELPPEVDTVTLSYTFFDVTEVASGSIRPPS